MTKVACECPDCDSNKEGICDAAEIAIDKDGFCLTYYEED